jgi:hypothetical protein
MVAVSFYEQFVGTDWERIAAITSQISAGTCITVGILSMFSGFNVWIGLYTMTVGLILSIWELPVIYSCVPRCGEFQAIALEQLYMKVPSTKGAVYILLSIVCFLQHTICVVAGLALLFSGILNEFAAYNRHADSVELGYTSADEGGPNENSPALGSAKFGTF